MTTIAERPQPKVSVVIEGYNESRLLGAVTETMDGLRRQEFPLDQVEVIIVGSRAQAEDWSKTYAHASPFAAVRVIAAEGAHYYALKNEGLRAAAGTIIALTDSDACPEPTWLPSMVAAVSEGADVTAGLTLFRGERGWPPDHALMQVAAAISWGFVVRDGPDGGSARPGGFLSHNVGFRADVLQRYQYREDLGRTCAGTFLYNRLSESGARIVLQPGQRVAHTFTLGWWVLRLHRRFGYEVWLLRRLRAGGSTHWLRRLAVIEPLLTMAWHMVLDVPQWFRVSRLLGVSVPRRLLLLPLVVGMSFLARGAEMIGMYQTLLSPSSMKRFAESN
jgi:glycosyltransferase involved in cell wall biosynthesis